jgi:hypothetical protein
MGISSSVAGNTAELVAVSQISFTGRIPAKFSLFRHYKNKIILEWQNQSAMRQVGKDDTMCGLTTLVGMTRVVIFLGIEVVGVGGTGASV